MYKTISDSTSKFKGVKYIGDVSNSRDQEIIKGLFPSRGMVNKNNLQITEESLYSISAPFDAHKITKAITQRLTQSSNFAFPEDMVCVDGTANIGGNTFSFANVFKEVVSVELDPLNFKALENNVNEYGFRNVEVFNDNFLTWMEKTSVTPDVLFLDPRWGGPNYSRTKPINLYLMDDSENDIEISKVVNSMPKKPWIVAIKAPLNTKFDKVPNSKFFEIYISKSIRLFIFEFAPSIGIDSMRDVSVSKIKHCANYVNPDILGQVDSYKGVPYIADGRIANVKDATTLSIFEDYVTDELYPYAYRADERGNAIIQNFYKLAREKYTLNETKSKYKYIIREWGAPSDSISNYFTEDIRARCQFGKFRTYYDAYTKLTTDQLLSDQYTPRERHDLLYSSPGVKTCNNFNEMFSVVCIDTAANIIGTTAESMKIIDPSAGWGDRLISAMARNVKEYQGYDPNEALSTRYQSIIETLPHKKGRIYDVEIIPFEESSPEEGHYDLLLTSPPFFDLEKYSDDETQSNVRYSSLEEWKAFYRNYIEKGIESLRDGGIAILYVDTHHNSLKLEQATRLYLEEFNVKYVTKIGFIHSDEGMSAKINEKNVRWALVYRK